MEHHNFHKGQIFQETTRIKHL